MIQAVVDGSFALKMGLRTKVILECCLHKQKDHDKSPADGAVVRTEDNHSNHGWRSGKVNPGANAQQSSAHLIIE